MAAMLAAAPDPYLRMIFGSTASSAKPGCTRGPSPGGGRNLHLHWPDTCSTAASPAASPRFPRPHIGALLRTIDRVKRSGGRVIWTAHNLAPHGYPSPHAEATYARLSRGDFPRVDTVMTLSPSSARAVRQAIPDLGPRPLRDDPASPLPRPFRPAGDRGDLRPARHSGGRASRLRRWPYPRLQAHPGLHRRLRGLRAKRRVPAGRRSLP